MKAIEVLDNLENYDLWDFKNYQLSKDEAEVCIAVLKYALKVDIDLNGRKENGREKDGVQGGA